MAQVWCIKTCWEILYRRMDRRYNGHMCGRTDTVKTVCQHCFTVGGNETPTKIANIQIWSSEQKQRPAWKLVWRDPCNTEFNKKTKTLKTSFPLLFTATFSHFYENNIINEMTLMIDLADSSFHCKYLEGETKQDVIWAHVSLCIIRKPWAHNKSHRRGVWTMHNIQDIFTHSL